ncbi:MAG: hypothetical protein HOG04_05455 [Nitrospinaceae bacterium]|jgi:hypothetical protein|nr:hypothetical protein [Nitrospinaceae bacterium]
MKRPDISDRFLAYLIFAATLVLITWFAFLSNRSPDWRLPGSPRLYRIPVASEDAPEQETLYLKGTTAAGQPEGYRFPTPSGKLEFWTEALEVKFSTLGLSALPEFYSDPEQLVDMPFAKTAHGDGELGVISPFHKAAPTGAARCRIVPPGEDSPGAVLREAGFDSELITARPPAPHFHS